MKYIEAKPFYFIYFYFFNSMNAVISHGYNYYPYSITTKNKARQVMVNLYT
jgi:hypothetical protein